MITNIYKLNIVGLVFLVIASVLFIPSVSNAVCSADGIEFTDAGDVVMVVVENPDGTERTEAKTCVPESAAEGQQFRSSGLFGCNKDAAYKMSVGALSAVGGVYVPVNDAAVTLNTGYFVYKECVLDGVTKKMAVQAATELANKGIIDALTGKDGGAYWPEYLAADILGRGNQSRQHTLDSGALSGINPAYRDIIERALARDPSIRRDPTRSLACPNQDAANAAVEQSQGLLSGGLLAVINPTCNAFGAFLGAKGYADTKDAAMVEEMLFRLTADPGFYGVEEYDPVTGQYRTLTPGSIVASNIQQFIQSGFEHTENVTEIDQMVGALFSSLSTHVISDSRGLTGLLQSNLGQPSYLEQMTREASKNLRDSAINAALQILSTSRQIETEYLNSMNAIAESLTLAVGQLRSAENSCWNLVVPATQSYASQQGIQITVATTTEFSQRAIDPLITSLASATVTNVEASERALSLINRLIAGVTNTGSLEAQRLALQQLDSLVAQGALHNQYDAQQANRQEQDVEDAMQDHLEDTVNDWTDSTDPNIGWCNVNEPNVIQTWTERWRK